jgi:hypothetical protein
MKPLFILLGLLLAAYVVQALVTGTVYAKSGVWGARFSRSENALRYWSALVCYGLLSLALLFVF